MQRNRQLWRACIPEWEPVKHALKKDYNTAAAFIGSDTLTGLSLFRYECHLFLYYETTDDKLLPVNILKNLSMYLREWPGEKYQRHWIALSDVFHFSQPLSPEHWERTTAVKKHIGKIGKLKPELISKYIFYHYALQEEKAFPGNKYEIIGLNENYLFGYFEEPVVIDNNNSGPGLKTNVVPAEWKDAGISECFIPWSQNNDDRFRIMDEILSIWKQDLNVIHKEGR